MMSMQYQFSFFLFLAVFTGLAELVDISDETKALLDVELHGQVDEAVSPGDSIDYTLTVKHHVVSKLDAVELEVEVLIPFFMTYLPHQTGGNVNDIIQNNSIAFKISKLPVKSNHSIQFSLNISDESLTAGIHYVVTPVRLNYKSILVNGQKTSYSSYVTSNFNVPMEIAGCSGPLGMSDKRIKFYQLSSSSAHVDLKPDKARIGPDGDAWCATVENEQQFVQVALAYETKITAISTWGRKEKDSWVKKYLFMHSLDGEEWTEYSENGFPKEFKANDNRNTEVKHWFLYSMTANFVRIRPLDWSVGVCMRFELYGCVTGKKKRRHEFCMGKQDVPWQFADLPCVSECTTVPGPPLPCGGNWVDDISAVAGGHPGEHRPLIGFVSLVSVKYFGASNLSCGPSWKTDAIATEYDQPQNCIGPLGMENGKIPSSSLSDSVTDSYSSPEYSRLNKIVPDYPYGWLGSSANEDWLQIDLGSQHKLSTIAMQGGYGEKVSSFYVTSFRLRYSNDTKKWSEITEDNTEKIFIGPKDQQEAMFPTLIQLPSGIQGRYFRILPDQFVSMKVMRTELYGCMVEPDFTNLDPPVTLSRRNILVDRKRNILFVCVYTELRDQSSCRKTFDGYSWKAIPRYIVSIVSQENESGKLYGIDQKMQIVRSEDYGDTWYSISATEWRSNLKIKGLQNNTNIDDILSTATPGQDLTWLTNSGMEWGVSGNGVHYKYPQGEDWTLVATWSCCGY